MEGGREREREGMSEVQIKWCGGQLLASGSPSPSLE